MLWAPLATAHAATFHVDGAAGSDANGGTSAAPFATIQRAIDEADESTTPGADTIIIEEGTYEEILTIEDDDALTLQGNGDVIFDGDEDADGYYGFNAIIVTDTDLTLERMTITDDANEATFHVDQDGGALTLTDVDFIGGGRFAVMARGLDALTVSGSTFTGFYQSAIDAEADAITITNSTLSDNGWYGLYLGGFTTLQLTQVDADDNGQSGIYMSASSSETEDVTIQNSSFDGNGIHGISGSPDTMTISNTTASDNNAFGLSMYVDDLTLSNVVVSNNLSNFIGGELIDISNLTANANTYAGLSLSADDVSISSLTLDGNGSYGTYISGGAHDFANVQATNNVAGGVFIDRADDVSLSAMNIQSNGGDGLFIDRSGDVVLQNLNAPNNGGDGIHVEDSGTVDLSGANANNNGDDGLEVLRSGAVTQSGSNFNNNGGDNVSIVP